MKKTIIMCCLSAAVSMSSHAQTTQKQNTPPAAQNLSSQARPAMSDLPANAKEMAALVNKSKMDEASALFQKIVTALSDELAATKNSLAASKGSKDEQLYTDLAKKQAEIYDRVLALGNNLQRGKDKLPTYLDEFINVSAKH